MRKLHLIYAGLFNKMSTIGASGTQCPTTGQNANTTSAHNALHYSTLGLLAYGLLIVLYAFIQNGKHNKNALNKERKSNSGFVLEKD